MNEAAEGKRCRNKRMRWGERWHKVDKEKEKDKLGEGPVIFLTALQQQGFLASKLSSQL